MTGDRSTETSDRIFGYTVLLIEKINQIYTKNCWKNRKRDCARGCTRGINTREKICRSKSTNQEGVRSAHRTDLCFSICRFSQVVFIPRVQPHAQSLFLFPIVFGINLTPPPPPPLSLSLSHRAHLTHNMGSPSTLPIIICVSATTSTCIYIKKIARVCFYLLRSPCVHFVVLPPGPPLGGQKSLRFRPLPNEFGLDPLPPILNRLHLETNL